MRDVSRLEGAELDYAVAQANGYERMPSGGWGRGGIGFYTEAMYAPSRDWSIGGPIIEREKIAIRYEYDEGWGATVYLPNGDTEDYLGPTPLIAAMRAFVAAAESRAKEDAKP
jgi:hypothetical protein